MLSIAFDPTTITNSTDTQYPPKVLINAELKKCFLDAATIFNTHRELYPSLWNTAASATGSAYLNTVTALYFNLMFGHTGIKSRYMHEVSRFLYTVATDYYSAEINTLSDEMPFSVEAPFPWEYTSRGFQYLRNYSLFDYIGGGAQADWTPLLGFCKERRIKLSSTKGPEVEVKVKKVLKVLDNSFEVPEEISSEELNTSIWLMSKLARQVGDDLGWVNTLKVQNVLLVTRKGQECSVNSLDSLELENILTQLKDSPALLKQLLWVGTASGPIA